METVGNLRAEEILEALDNEQRAVALATRGPVCVIAGAGTGKTRAITHRIAYAAAIGTMDPHKVLALTFTARAAGEMRSRLRSLGVQSVAARTIHAAALKQLTFFWPHLLTHFAIERPIFWCWQRCWLAITTREALYCFTRVTE